MAEAYPLQWPDGWPRTRSPERSRFDVTPDRARREMVIELERFGASNIVISTNVPLRKDGNPFNKPPVIWDTDV